MDISIQVIDQDIAIRNLKRIGVKAVPHALLDDEIIVNSKDKVNVIKWMLNSGWTADDLEDIYPELLEGKSGKSFNKLIEKNL